MELLQPRPPKAGGRERPESLTTARMLPPQAVDELGLAIGSDLLEVPVGVADANVLPPAPQDRVHGPDLLRQAGEVLVTNRLADLVSATVPRLRGGPAIAEPSLRVAPPGLQAEVPPEAVEPLGGLDDPRLLRVEGSPQAGDDALPPLEPRLRIPAAEDHVIVPRAEQLRTARLRLPLDVEGVPVCVRPQR